MVAHTRLVVMFWLMLAATGLTSCSSPTPPGKSAEESAEAGPSHHSLLFSANDSVEVSLELPSESSFTGHHLQALTISLKAPLESSAVSREFRTKLERHRVFTADAKIVVHRDSGDETILVEDCEGTVRSGFLQDGYAHVSAHSDGACGFLARAGETFAVHAAKGQNLGAPQKLTGQSSWECHADQFSSYSPEPQEKASGQGTLDTILLAVEVDQKLYQKGIPLPKGIPLKGDPEKSKKAEQVCQDVGELMAGVFSIYRREVRLPMQISYLGIWDKEDPYTSNTNNPSTEATWKKLQKHWMDNMGGVDRTLTLLLSGVDFGGIAHTEALCSPEENGYAVAGVIALHGDPCPPKDYFWPFDVVSHELGHNLGATHTHERKRPIDKCWCPNPCGCSKAVVACNIDDITPQVGTIMSYCHKSWGKYLKFHDETVEQIRSWIAAPQCKTTD